MLNFNLAFGFVDGYRVHRAAQEETSPSGAFHNEKKGKKKPGNTPGFLAKNFSLKELVGFGRSAAGAGQ